MATNKTFSVVGISKLNGQYKVRFANDIMRIKVLAKHGHQDIRLAELDKPLTKLDAVKSIKGLDEYSDVHARTCIDDWLSENTPRVKVSATQEVESA